jgi:hypothetical protein
LRRRRRPWRGDACGEEVLGSGVEVIDGVGGLCGGEAVLSAEAEHLVGEAGALLRAVDLVCHRAELVPAVVEIVLGDGIAQSLQFGGDELRELDVQGEVDRS